MPIQQLPFVQNGDPRLELEWSGDYMRNFVIRFDGKQIGEISGGQRELRNEHKYTLPDGSNLTIRLKQSKLLDELVVLRNGNPLPGSATDPLQHLTAAVRASFFCGIALIILGLIALFRPDNMQAITITPYSAVIGLILLFVAVGISRRSRLAAWVGLLAFIADVIIWQRTGGNLTVFITSIALLLRLFWGVRIWLGVRATR